MEFYKNIFGDAVEFWFFSDAAAWDDYGKFLSWFPNTRIHMPNLDDELFLTFHRMVMADGLITSHSSLSFAAALFSNCSRIVTYDCLQDTAYLYQYTDTPLDCAQHDQRFHWYVTVFRPISMWSL
jgi:hypothetical protein